MFNFSLGGISPPRDDVTWNNRERGNGSSREQGRRDVMSLFHRWMAAWREYRLYDGWFSIFEPWSAYRQARQSAG
jgi:hypothetical protein